MVQELWAISYELGVSAWQALLAYVNHDSGGCEHRQTGAEETALVVAGKVFEDVHPVGADEAADDAKGIHGSEAGCGGPALEEACG
jgi:hypothetical protein